MRLKHFLLFAITLITLSFYSFKTPALLINRTIYFDPIISNQNIILLTQAAAEWNIATNHQVKFTIKNLGLIDNEHINPNNSVIFLEVSNYYPKILESDLINKYYTLGYYDDFNMIPYIYIVPDRLVNNDLYYKTVILHELGHYLGLKHNLNKEDVGSLMYPLMDFGSTSITAKDIRQFNKIYN